MTTTALVPVFAGTLAGQPTQLCNARDLHAVIESGQEFANWIKNRIEQYGFADGEDFLTRVSKTRGRPRTDYHLTLDMAKELAMVENNEQGRKVRRYFIRVENEARAKAQAAALPAPAFDLRTAMLASSSTPTVPLPPAVQAALNRKAWALAGNAYELLREQIARRVAYTAEMGMPRHINEQRALAAISEMTLDAALAPEHFNKLQGMLLTMELFAEAGAGYVKAMRQVLKENGILQ